MQLELFEASINKLPKSKENKTPAFAPIVRDVANRSIFAQYESITPANFQNAIRQAQDGDTENLMALLDLAELKESVLVETLHKRKTMVASKPIEIIIPQDANRKLQKIKSFLDDHYVPKLRNRIYTLLDATYRGICILNNLWGYVKHNGHTYYTIKNQYRVDPRRIVFGNYKHRFAPVDEIYLKDWTGKGGEYRLEDFIVGTFTTHFSKIRETNYPVPLSAIGVTALILYGLKTTKLKDWLRYCENYGFPMLSFAYDPMNDQSNDREVFLEFGSKLITEGSIIHSKNSEIRNLQVASQGGAGTFREIVNYFEELIIELILMQTNTTRNSYGSGSYANNEVYQSGEFAMVLWDSVNLEHTLNQEIETIVKINFGELDVYPKLDIKAEPPSDLLTELEKIAGLYALGVDIPLSMIQKQFGISEVEEGEKVLSYFDAELKKAHIKLGLDFNMSKDLANVAKSIADEMPDEIKKKIKPKLKKQK